MAVLIKNSSMIFSKIRTATNCKELIFPQVISRINFQSTNANAKKNENVKQNPGSQIDIARESPYAGLSAGEKVKEATKDVTYLGISVAALAALGAMAYYIGKELFSGDSPNGVYTRALKHCLENSEVTVMLGEPIKGYGEMTRRGRRRHVSHTEYLDNDGKKHLRMKFYLEGPDKKATANLEMVMNESNHYEYRYLFVQEDLYPHRIVIIEDNR